MGRASGTSCFRIMTCGSNNADDDDGDDFDVTEGKGSPDKSRWSIHNQSGRRKVQRNAAVSGERDCEGVSQNISHGRLDSYDPEKSTAARCEGHATPELPSEKESTSDTNDFQESSAIVIQAAVRGFLSRRQSRRLKNIVKLQAAMRGRLVRRQAITTLRCVQAVVKMQTLVRTRTERGETSQRKAKKSESPQKQSSDAKLNRQSSIERLLKNGFARLLLESRPKPKSIYISCEPSRSESAWKWLERWMAVSSYDGEQRGEFNVNSEEQGEYSSKPTKSQMPAKVMMMNHGADNGLQLSKSSAGNKFLCLIEDSKGKKPVIDNNEANSEMDTISRGSIPKGAHVSCDAVVQSDIPPESPTEKNSSDVEKLKAQTVNKKSGYPSFASARSKFENLTTGSAPGWSFKLHQRSASVPDTDGLPTQTNSSTRDEPLKLEKDDDAGGHEKSGNARSLSAAEALQNQGRIDENHGNSTYADRTTVEHLLAVSERSRVNVRPDDETSPQEKVSGQEYARTNQENAGLQGKPFSRSPADPEKNRKENSPSIKNEKSKDLRKKPSPGKKKSDDSQKDSRRVKGTNSFDMDKPDLTEQEPPNRNRSPLPSYMQDTKSTRMRSRATNSPPQRMDNPDRGNHTRKKHPSPSRMIREQVSSTHHIYNESQGTNSGRCRADSV